MDPLSQVVVLLQPQTAGWRLLEGAGGWTMRARPDPNVVVFGQSIRGGAEVVRDDGRSLHTAEGDFILMPCPPPWELRAGGGGAPIELKALLSGAARLPQDEDAVQTRFMGGHFKFSPAGVELLGRLMPPVVHVRAAEVRAGRIGALLSLLADEAVAERPGGEEVLKRLLEVLLIEVLRRPRSRGVGADWDAARPGLLAGLADPRLAPALRRLHDDPARGWSVGELARACGMSRSVFAERFARVVGAPPLDYLADWRMLLAKRALATGDAAMIEIAEQAGFRSVSAFSTAFRRRTGQPPSRYARSNREAPDVWVGENSSRSPNPEEPPARLPSLRAAR